MQQNENFAKQAEHAEAERQEVVDFNPYRYHAEKIRQRADGAASAYEAGRSALGYMEDIAESALIVRNGLDELSAQHERITAKLHDALDESDGDRWKMRSERDAANARLHEVATACATAEQERDAALARTAELAQALRHLLHNIKASGKRIDLGLAKECAEAALARIDSTAPSQAQHSVPEGFREKFKQCMELAFAEIAFYVSPEKARNPNSRARKASALATELLDMLAAAPGTEVPQAWLDVQAERLRQVEAEGWMPEHDDAHSHGKMARAAACYALAGSSAPNDGTAALLVSLAWPWDEQWWKPTSARRDLIKACALTLAEIERLDRAAPAEGGDA